MTNKQLQRKSTKWLQVLEDRSNINYLTVIDEQFLRSKFRFNQQPCSENELKEIFDYIDVNADGFISLIDLQMVLNELMPKLSEKDVAEMFAIVKKTDKTQICYE